MTFLTMLVISICLTIIAIGFYQIGYSNGYMDKRHIGGVKDD